MRDRGDAREQQRGVHFRWMNTATITPSSAHQDQQLRQRQGVPRRLGALRGRCLRGHGVRGPWCAPEDERPETGGAGAATVEDEAEDDGGSALGSPCARWEGGLRDRPRLELLRLATAVALGSVPGSAAALHWHRC